jgi:ATP-dependent Lon protease
MNVAKTNAWNMLTDECKKEWLQYFKDTNCQGIHIHCPDGAVSKDGPSAGAAITIAIFSLFTKKPINNTVAITGEITLQGNITAIGGLESKILGGIKAGITKFLFPLSNKQDFESFQEDNKNNILLDNIEFIEVSNIEDVFEHVFTT